MYGPRDSESERGTSPSLNYHSAAAVGKLVWETRMSQRQRLVSRFSAVRKQWSVHHGVWK